MVIDRGMRRSRRESPDGGCPTGPGPLKRYLESISATPEQFDSMAFADLVRSGSEQGLLLHAWPEWRRYRDMRSRTSHTYNENVALEVVGGIPAFLLEAKHFYDQMRRRL